MALSLATLTACAPQPMTLERAERLCREELPLADGVAGTVGIGVGNTGARARGGVTITNRVFDPQTPSEFMAECVARQMENRPKPTTFGITVGGSL